VTDVNVYPGSLGPAAVAPGHRAATVAICSIILVIAGIVPVLPSVSAHHTGTSRTMGVSVNETVTLPVNNWTGYRTQMDPRDRIAYDIREVSGSLIDLYILPQGGFNAYQRDDTFAFTYFEIHERSSHPVGEFWNTGGQAETVYFVVDNVDITGAEPVGEVTVQIRLGPPPAEPLPIVVLATCGIGFALAIGLGIALAVRQRRKRRAAAELLPPPPPPPPP